MLGAKIYILPASVPAPTTFALLSYKERIKNLVKNWFIVRAHMNIEPFEDTYQYGVDMVVDCGSYFLVATPHEATKVLPAPLLELEVAPLQLQSVAW